MTFQSTNIGIGNPNPVGSGDVSEFSPHGGCWAHLKPEIFPRASGHQQSMDVFLTDLTVTVEKK